MLSAGSPSVDVPTAGNSDLVVSGAVEVVVTAVGDAVVAVATADGAVEGKIVALFGVRARLAPPSWPAGDSRR